jgi:hypothetical protein
LNKHWCDPPWPREMGEIARSISDWDKLTE